MASNKVARSLTVLAIGPSEPAISGQPPNTPPRLTSPAVGRIPVMQFQVAGRRNDARPSGATATVEKFFSFTPRKIYYQLHGSRNGSKIKGINPNSEPCV